MPNKNFSEFAVRTTGLLNTDYIIGYNPAGPSEFRTNVGNLLSGGTNSEHVQYSFVLMHNSTDYLEASKPYFFGQQPDRNMDTGSSNTTVVYPPCSGAIKYASIQTFIAGLCASKDAPGGNVYSIESSRGTGISQAITSFFPLSTKASGGLFTINPPIPVAPGDKLHIKFIPAINITSPTTPAIKLVTVINLFIF
jgi:hypothetical protein